MIDLTNQRFGRLIVLNKNPFKKSHRGVYWNCICDCGNYCTVCSIDLRQGKTKSCGCLQKESRHKRLIDLTGQRFNYLMVLQLDKEKTEKYHTTYWICQCLLCNNIKTIKGSHLKNGSIQSCGCLKSQYELKILNILKDNNINFKYQYSFPDLKGDKKRLFFDFAIFNKNELKYLIEYQGEQHYRSVNYFGGEDKFQLQLKYDKKKIIYCENHNIPLIILNKQNNLNKEEIIREELLYGHS